MSDTTVVARGSTVLIPSGPNQSGDNRHRNWVPLKNEMGKFKMLRKSKLGIDDKYQRKVNDRLVARLAANWSWVACGVIEVSTRDNGVTWFIVDGQHRWEAAKYLDWVTELPCLCFELDTVRDEAIGFLAANSDRRMVSLADQFKALIVAGDPLAIHAGKLATQYSRKISAPASPTTISCVSDFMRCLQQNRAAMDRVFPVMADICSGRIMPGRLFRAMHGLERRVVNGTSLAEPRWHKRIRDIGLDEILDSIRAVTLIEHNAGDRACAQGLLRAINKGLRHGNQLQANMDIIRR